MTMIDVLMEGFLKKYVLENKICLFLLKPLLI